MALEFSVKKSVENSPPDPRSEYDRRIESWQEKVEKNSRLEAWVSGGRLIVFLLGAAAVWLSWRSGEFPAAWVSLPVILFFLLVVFHQYLIQTRRRAEGGVSFYRMGMARIEDRWAGNGEAGTRYCREGNLFARDLDLFGKGSLFQLLSTARTRAGEMRLANWLQEPASAEEVRSRQIAVEELSSRLDLREDLAVLGEEVRCGVRPEEVSAWGLKPTALPSPLVRIGILLPVFFTVAAGCGWMAWGWGPIPFFLGLAMEGAIALALRSRVRGMISGVEEWGQELAILSLILARLERERFECDHLTRLESILDTNGSPPSRRIRRLGRWIELLDSRRNQFFAPLAAILLWTTHIAFAIEAWRKVAGPAVSKWLMAVGEFEALCSLASYRFEHPADPFPEIIPGSPRFEAEGLGHPLIPEAKCVRNDLCLDERTRLFIVSGSNMSGKSTLLRTVGVNAVLALAGAPVRARRLVLSPLSVGASIQVVDSLQAGSSRFYAEITRLHEIQEIANGSFRVLFLLDEILHGTNSHDRRIGAEAVLIGFLDRGGIGLITTHDLALAKIADGMDGKAENIHFEDQFVDGKIGFDFRIRPGIVKKSNALQLMRSIGIDV